MRSFIALDLPQEVKDYLFELQRKNKTKDATITWVAKKNLHLTLKFLGDIDQEKAEHIKERLQRIKVKKISARLNNIGSFSHDNTSVLWVGLEPEEDIIKLARNIDEETLDLIAREQSFKAHLTLGRAKGIKNKAAFSSFLKKITLEKITFTLDTFSFYKSTLTSQGPTHHILKTYTLH